MKITQLIFKIYFLALPLFVFACNNDGQAKSTEIMTAQNPGDTSAPPKTKLDKNIYEDLKRMAYNVRYDQLNLPDAGNKEVLYGTMMDWDYEGRAIITLLTFKTGDVSLYFSSGTMMIGAGQHDDVKKAGSIFLQKAEALLPNASNSDTALTSEKGVLKFYLLTNKGKYTIKDKMENVYNHSSPLADMFDEANKLITLIRLAEEKTKKGDKN